MLEENRFENVLASLRARRGWTQKDAAAHIEELGEGLNLRTYIKVETGRLPPSDKHLKLITAGFKLDQPDIDALYYAAHHGSPRLHNLPFPRNPLFTGRETQLEQLQQSLQDNGSVALTQPISISGLGGIGKTQLALEYAYRCYPKVYRAVFWVSAADEETLQGSYVKLAHRLELPERDEQEQELIIQAVKDWLERHTNWLLIMDNADDLELARSFFPEAYHEQAFRGRILLTTRSQIDSDVVATQIEIDKMKPDEGLHFLLRRTRKVQGDTTPDAVAADIREPAARLVELLDGHPLALDQAGAYIHEAHVSFADYITLYDKTRRELLDTRWLLDDEHRAHPEYSHHPESVAVTFDLCFKQARARQPLAGNILDFCAFLSPDAIPEELFQHDGSFNYGTTVFNKAIAALLRYSLIKRNDQEKTLSLHRLVQAVLIDAMSSDLQKQWRERELRALHAAFPTLEFTAWNQCERLLSHTLVCSTWSDDEVTPIVGAAVLFHKAGVYLHERGRYSEAGTLLERVVSIHKQNLGTEHPITAYAQTDLATIYASQYKREQAEDLYKKALEILVNQLGDEHPITANCMRDLASFYIHYMHQDKYEQAEELLKRSLSIYKKHLRTNHPDRVRCLEDLSTLYSKQGKREQANDLLGQVLAITDGQLEASHPDIAHSVTLTALSFALHEQGQHDLAERLYQRALSIKEQRYGATHPVTQRYKSDYVDFLCRIGYDAALEANDEPSV